MLSDKLSKDLRDLIDGEKPRTFAAIDGQAYAGKVPDFLIELWKAVGVASWSDGSYQTVNPEHFDSAVTHALRGSPLRAEGLVPFMMFAFGRLTCWHPDWGLVNVDPVEASVTVLADPKHRLDASLRDIEIMSAFAGMGGDDTNFGLYRSAVKKLGSLGENEVFAFVPAITLGGSFTIKSVQKQIADVHLDILCQTTAFKAFRVEGGFGQAEIVPLT